MAIAVWNILDLVDQNGDEVISEIISDFSCSRLVNGSTRNLNPDIEHFLKENAIQFAKEKKSVTYIVGDNETGDILGYFTIAHKAVEIPADGLSKTTIKKMCRYAEINEKSNTFTVSGFLIAQFGKNYSVDDGNRITGKELMHLTHNELLDLQRRVGGGIIYLDCEADAQLISFYEGEGFRLFGERLSQKDGKSYLQYMKFF